LTKEGKLLAMGEDTFGQCGVGREVNGEARMMVAPFDETRHRKPVGVLLPNDVKVKKIVAGSRHSLAITEDGRVFAWGYNSK